MRLTRIDIRSAPGLVNGLPALDLGPGLTLIAGPNGSGKSTIARTLAATLWPKEAMLDASAESHWQIGEETYKATLFGHAVRWLPEPAELPARGASKLARFGIKSLLATEDSSDREIAAELARELAGGFDLAAAKATFDTSPRFSTQSKVAKTFRVAKEGLNEAKQSSNRLERSELELQNLDLQIEAAERAKRSTDAGRRLQEVLSALARASQHEATYSEFPRVLLDLNGREAEELAELEPALENLKRELSEAEQDRDEHQRRIAKLTGERSLAQSEELETWALRIETLRDLERESHEKSADLDAAVAELKSVHQRILAPNRTGETRLDASTLEGLGEAIQIWRTSNAVLQSTTHTADLWGAWSQTKADDSDSEAPKDLEGGLAALRLWLRSPPPENPVAIKGARKPLALAIGAMALGALGALITGLLLGEDFGFASVVGFVLLGLWGLGSFWVQRQALGKGSEAMSVPTQQEDAERAGERAGLDLVAWTDSSVEQELARLEKLRDIKSSDVRLAERAEAERVSLEADLQRVRMEASKRREALIECGQLAGVPETWLDLGAAAQVEALVALGRALDNEAAARARAEATESKRKQLHEKASEWLVGLGYRPPADVASLRAGQAALVKREHELDIENSALQQAELTCKRLNRQVSEQAIKHDAIWKRVGLEPGKTAELEGLMSQFGGLQKCREQKRDADNELTSARQRLAVVQAGDDGDCLMGLLTEGQDPEQVPLETLVEWTEAQSKQSDLLKDLSHERGGIQNSLAEASRGKLLADAIAHMRDAAEQVATKREVAMRDAMAGALISMAERQQRSDHTPHLLKRAQEYFGRFTQGTWRIELGPDRNFAAVDLATNRRRSLDELSDGTRVQLLLAARLSALESRENKRPVPICLDEALATTDSQRFEAIASALFKIAEDRTSPRQVLYFTADSGELEQWRHVARKLNRPEPPTVYINHLNGESADWGGKFSPQPKAPPSPPNPANCSPEEYARKLGVSAPDGFTGPSTWHLYTLAFDQPLALSSCLTWGLSSVGAWRASHEAGRLPLDLSPEITRLFELRLELANSFSRQWRHGRGRPVTWRDIDESGAVTPTFEQRVREILEHFYRDARQFIKELSTLQRFEKQAKKLEDHLIDCGALSTDKPHLPEELLHRTLVGAKATTEELGVEESGAYVNWLASILRD